MATEIIILLGREKAFEFVGEIGEDVLPSIVVKKRRLHSVKALGIKSLGGGKEK